MSTIADFDAVKELRIEADTIEYRHGPNAYSKFLRDHNRRPDRAEAAGIGTMLGGRVRAADGTMQPPLTKAQKQFLKEQREEQKAWAKRMERLAALRAIVAAFQDCEDPGAHEIVAACYTHMEQHYADVDWIWKGKMG